MKTCIRRVLDEERDKWTNGGEPSVEDDCYVSHEAIDIIQVTLEHKLHQN